MAIKETSKELTDNGQKSHISFMCKVLNVKRANYYKWLKKPKSKQLIRYEELMEYVKKYDIKFKQLLGYRTMRDRIERDEKQSYSDKEVYTVMCYLGLSSKIRQKRIGCTKTNRNASRAENKLKREFEAKRPNEKWVTDVTEIKYGKHNEYKLYISLILDLYDRMPVACQFNDSNNNQLVFETLREAHEKNPKAHPLFHSDAGFQYTSPAFINMLKQYGMTQSMSRVGSCIDNGPMEGFWGIIKTEIYAHQKTFKTKEELIEAIEKELEYYTYERYQRRFGIKTPYEVRMEGLEAEKPKEYPIPFNKAIHDYKIEKYGHA